MPADPPDAPTTDPFVHHPELRGLIKDPETSFFRDFEARRLIRERPEMAAFVQIMHSDAQRQAMLASALQGHGGDLWVFGYGSLMWDPAFHFLEVRRAHAPGHGRRFNLRDIHGARGNADAPGLMASLDIGGGCDGLAFRIAADQIDCETDILCRRELVAPGYLPQFIDIQAGEPLRALTFLADHAAPPIVDLPRAETVRLLATGTGFLGSSLDYLAGIAAQLQVLGIEDADVIGLLAEVQAYRAEREIA